MSSEKDTECRWCISIVDTLTTRKTTRNDDMMGAMRRVKQNQPLSQRRERQELNLKLSWLSRGEP